MGPFAQVTYQHLLASYLQWEPKYSISVAASSMLFWGIHH